MCQAEEVFHDVHVSCGAIAYVSGIFLEIATGATNWASLVLRICRLHTSIQAYCGTYREWEGKIVYESY